MEKFMILLANNNETIEVLTVLDYLRRSDIKVDLVSTEEGLDLVTSHGVKYMADLNLADIDIDDYMGLYIPGGTKGAESLRDNDKVIRIIKDFDQKEKLIGAICAGPIVLNKAGILLDKKATSHPSVKDQMDKTATYLEDEILVEDGHIVTSRGAALTNYLALKLVEKIKGKQAKEVLKPAIQQDMVEKYYGFNF
ncbi:MAG: DJ-1/PfpI family protein [Anaerococcus sp.]|nr:DJ-1/PfpI family protein [Anaerococcus sp.]